MNFNRLTGGGRALASAAAALVMGSDDDRGGNASDTDPAADPVADPAPQPDPAPVPDPVADPVVDPEPVADPVPPAAAKSEVELRADGRAEMHERITTVFASEHVAGREAAAAELLAADLSADRIVATLGKLPKGSGADMLAGIRGSIMNPDLGAGGESEPRGSSPSAFWSGVHGSLGWDRK